jgi:hypothetical protein
MGEQAMFGGQVLVCEPPIALRRGIDEPPGAGELGGTLLAGGLAGGVAAAVMLGVARGPGTGVGTGGRVGITGLVGTATAGAGPVVGVKAGTGVGTA